MLIWRNEQTLKTSFERSTSTDLYICPLHVTRLTTGSGALNVAGVRLRLRGNKLGPTHYIHHAGALDSGPEGRETKLKYTNDDSLRVTVQFYYLLLIYYYLFICLIPTGLCCSLVQPVPPHHGFLLSLSH